MRVAKIERVPFDGEVYNLTVLDDESYIANGLIVHNCRCTVVSLSEREVEREGLIISPSPKIETYEWTDKRTGEVREVPVGIDPGWDINVGKLGMMAGLL